MAKNAMSLQGWDWKQWLFGNGKTIKELLKVGVPYFVSMAITAMPELQFLITAVGKLVLDSAEYYIKAR